MESREEGELVFQNKDLIGIGYNSFWIGVINYNDQWTYDNLQPVTWTNWAGGHPNGEGNCVSSVNPPPDQYNFQWYDISCSAPITTCNYPGGLGCYPLCEC